MQLGPRALPELLDKQERRARTVQLEPPDLPDQQVQPEQMVQLDPRALPEQRVQLDLLVLTGLPDLLDKQERRARMAQLAPPGLPDQSGPRARMEPQVLLDLPVLPERMALQVRLVLLV